MPAVSESGDNKASVWHEFKLTKAEARIAANIGMHRPAASETRTGASEPPMR